MDSKKISDYVEKYDSLWLALRRYDLKFPCMDIDLTNINENDYYGCDFRGDQDVFRLFFLGSSDYFPCIHNLKGEKLEESPVYILDLSSGEHGFETTGNFKTYFKTLLQDFIDHYNDPDERKNLNNRDNENRDQDDNYDINEQYNDAVQALKELDQFSDILCRNDKYFIKICD
jgi:hypothetical protein